jgi:hypothetical protein
MKKLILALAAALTLGGGIAATSADAQPRNRTVVRTTHTVVVNRHTNYNNRGNHYGWRNHNRNCRTIWRGHRRIRTCRSW